MTFPVHKAKYTIGSEKYNKEMNHKTNREMKLTTHKMGTYFPVVLRISLRQATMFTWEC